MGKTAVLSGPASDLCRSLFARYYRETPLPAPRHPEMREYALFPFDAPGMRRHMGFPSPERLRETLGSQVPRHVYYSSAYYARPDHPSMKLKGWQGADVIFDLDADHLRKAETMDYPAQLRLVRDRFRLLLDEYLFGDFGLDEREVTLAFSGGRGYHAHIHDAAYLGLRSDERRELVEFVMGIGFDPALEAMHEEGVEGTAPGAESGPYGEPKASGRPGRPLPTHRLYGPTDPGWRGRFARSLYRFLARWEKMPAEAVAQEIVSTAGLPPPRARAMARALVEEGMARRIRESGSLEVLSPSLRKEFLSAVASTVAVEVQGETDAPVTTDIHRLIRLPGSLHGGTGFRVRPLARGELDGFDPWTDALFPSVPGSSLRVRIRTPVDYPMDGGLRAASGETVDLSEAAALFLLLRGEAELPG